MAVFRVTLLDDREFMILGKLVLTFGCLLAWPLWELWKLKRREAEEHRKSSEDEAVHRNR